MVYIIHAKTTNLVKIGVCINLSKRLSGLQTSCPVELEVLCIFYSDGEIVERKLHRRFFKHRVRGEWFELEGDLLRFVESNRLTNEKVKDFLGVKIPGDNRPEWEKTLEVESTME